MASGITPPMLEDLGCRPNASPGELPVDAKDEAVDRAVPLGPTRSGRRQPLEVVRDVGVEAPPGVAAVGGQASITDDRRESLIRGIRAAGGVADVADEKDLAAVEVRARVVLDILDRRVLGGQSRGIEAVA